jgi:hypothetical protein
MLQTSNTSDVAFHIAPCCNRSSNGKFLIRVMEHGGDGTWRAMGAQRMVAQRSGARAAHGGALVLLHRIGGPWGIQTHARSGRLGASCVIHLLAPCVRCMHIAIFLDGGIQGECERRCWLRITHTDRYNWSSGDQPGEQFSKDGSGCPDIGNIRYSYLCLL